MAQAKLCGSMRINFYILLIQVSPPSPWRKTPVNWEAHLAGPEINSERNGSGESYLPVCSECNPFSMHNIVKTCENNWTHLQRMWRHVELKRLKAKDPSYSPGANENRWGQLVRHFTFQTRTHHWGQRLRQISEQIYVCDLVCQKGCIRFVPDNDSLELEAI